MFKKLCLAGLVTACVAVTPNVADAFGGRRVVRRHAPVARYYAPPVSSYYRAPAYYRPSVSVGVSPYGYSPYQNRSYYGSGYRGYGGYGYGGYGYGGGVSIGIGRGINIGW